MKLDVENGLKLNVGCVLVSSACQGLDAFFLGQITVFPIICPPSLHTMGNTVYHRDSSFHCLRQINSSHDSTYSILKGMV